MHGGADFAGAPGTHGSGIVA